MQRPNNQYFREWQKRNKKTNLSEKNLIGIEFWRNVYVCGLPMREKFLKTIHYGLRKGNKNFVTFATNFVTFATNNNN